MARSRPRAFAVHCVFGWSGALLGCAVLGHRTASGGGSESEVGGFTPASHAAAAPTGVAKSKAARADLYGDALPDGAIARLGTVRFRHDASCVAYSPDGTILASGGEDNQIRLFDPQTGKVIRTLRGHDKRTYEAARTEGQADDVLVQSVGSGNVTALAFTPDNRVLASGGWDDSIRLWAVASGEQVRRIEAHRGMVASVVYSRDGRILVSRGGIDGLVKVWNPDTGAELRRFAGLAKVNPWRFNRAAPLAIAPDGATIAVGDKQVIHFFDAQSGVEQQTWEAHPTCLFLAYSHDGALLASSGVDGEDLHSLRIWDVASGKELCRCALPKDEPPIHFAFSPDDAQLAAVIEEDDLHVFDVKGGKLAQTLPHYWPSRVAYAPDGATFVSVRGPALRLWDAATGRERFTEFAGHQAPVSCVAVSKDGKWTASGGDGVRIWETATGKPLRHIPIKGAVHALAFSPDDTKLASAGSDKVVHLWDVSTGEPAGELKGHTHALCAVAWSPDGTRIASGDTQATIRLYDVATWSESRVIDVQSLTEKLSLAFSPDGSNLVCGGAWNDTSFLPEGGLDLQGVRVTGKQGYAALMWDAKTGADQRRFEGLNDNLRSVAFSPNGTLLAAASRDGRIGVWETASAKELLYILAHPDAGRSAAIDAVSGAYPSVVFAKDGGSLVSAGADGTIRRFDVHTGKELARFDAPDTLEAIALAADGRTLVSGSKDTALLAWDLSAAPSPKPKNASRTILIGD